MITVSCTGVSPERVRAILEAGLGAAHKITVLDVADDDPATNVSAAVSWADSSDSVAAVGDLVKQLHVSVGSRPSKVENAVPVRYGAQRPVGSPEKEPRGGARQPSTPRGEGGGVPPPSPPRSPLRNNQQTQLLSPCGSPRCGKGRSNEAFDLKRRTPSPPMPRKDTGFVGGGGGGDENADDQPSTAALQSRIAALTASLEKHKRELRRRDRKVADLEHSVADGEATANSLHAQQRQLFDKFCLLRQKYDGIKAHLREVLWDFLPSRSIPGVENHGPAWIDSIPALDKTVVETADRIGCYELMETLGEGQFAAVRALRVAWPESGAPPASDAAAASAAAAPAAGAAWSASGGGIGGGAKPGTLAVKMIHKAEVVSTTTLRRVDNEIRVLRRLRHGGIMRLYDVVHAPKCVYLVTDRAGRDLFEFFDEHLEGVSEATAALLLHKIMMPVRYCHAMGVCHRDLKPENILFADTDPFTAASRVLLCDFGLCARVETDAEEAALRAAGRRTRPLGEFCGSPGFFAPEMLVRGSYDGKLADVWSLGCILLELVLGHEDFCRLWMGAYEYDKLKVPVHFEAAVAASVAALGRELPSRLSPELVDFILTALSLDDSRRRTVSDMLRHPWMAAHRLAPTEADLVAFAAEAAAEAVAADAGDADTETAAAAAKANSGIIGGVGRCSSCQRAADGVGAVPVAAAAFVVPAAAVLAAATTPLVAVAESSTDAVAAVEAADNGRWQHAHMGLRIDIELLEGESTLAAAAPPSSAADSVTSLTDDLSAVAAASKAAAATAAERAAFADRSAAAESVDGEVPLEGTGAVGASGSEGAAESDKASSAGAPVLKIPDAPEKREEEEVPVPPRSAAAAAEAAAGCSISDRARKQLPGGYLPPPCLPDTPSVQNMRKQFIQPTDEMMSKQYPQNKPQHGGGGGGVGGGIGVGSSYSSASHSPTTSPSVTPTGGSPLRKAAFFHVRGALNDFGTADTGSLSPAPTFPCSGGSGVSSACDFLHVATGGTFGFEGGGRPSALTPATAAPSPVPSATPAGMVPVLHSSAGIPPRGAVAAALLLSRSSLLPLPSPVPRTGCTGGEPFSAAAGGLSGPGGRSRALVGLAPPSKLGMPRGGGGGPSSC